MRQVVAVGDVGPGEVAEAPVEDDRLAGVQRDDVLAGDDVRMARVGPPRDIDAVARAFSLLPREFSAVEEPPPTEET